MSIANGYIHGLFSSKVTVGSSHANMTIRMCTVLEWVDVWYKILVSIVVKNHYYGDDVEIFSCC